MGLIAWYPLNGNLKDYGGNYPDWKNNNLIQYESGKIGKTYHFSSTEYGELSINGIAPKENSEFSIAYWVKELKDKSSAGFRVVYQSGGYIIGQYRDHFDSYFTGGGGDVNSSSIDLTKWNHCVVTCTKNGIMTIYVNGKKESSTQISKYPTAGSTYLGRRTAGGSNADTDMYINDLRLYDHCLSNEEIKQIYNCLILHYPLSNGYGNENLIEEGNLASSWGEEGCTRENVVDSSKGNCLKVIGKNGNKRIYRAVKNVWTINNQKYQVSFWAKTDTENCQINFSRSMTDYTKDFTLTSNWNYYIGTITTTGIGDSGTLSLTVKTTNGIIYIKDIKLQKGTDQMIYSPHPSDALYKTLGYNTTTEYDTSGFGNNGTKFGTITSSSDSPIGNSSYYIPSTAYINTNSALHTYDQITMSIWFKGANNCHFGNWESGGCGLWTENNKWKATVYANSKYNDITGGALQNGWNFAAMTYDGQVIKIYNNGIETGKLNLGSKYAIQWHPTAPWTINGNPNATGSSVDQRVTGYWADARLYATALTADDIKQLYQTKAKIDKNGNLYGNQFVDNDYEEELLTTQKMTFNQQNSQGTITYETNGNEIINIITMKDTISGWKYLLNTAFDKTKIINHKLKLNFKYKTDISNEYSLLVKMCKGDSTKPQTISNGKIIPKSDWQEYNGIITFGNTYDNQGIYISYEGNFCGGNLYIKDLSLKIYENNNKTDFTKKSQIITGELSELDSNKTYMYKSSKIVTNQIIEN